MERTPSQHRSSSIRRPEGLMACYSGNVDNNGPTSTLLSLNCTLLYQPTEVAIYTSTHRWSIQHRARRNVLLSATTGMGFECPDEDSPAQYPKPYTSKPKPYSGTTPCKFVHLAAHRLIRHRHTVTNLACIAHCYVQKWPLS